MPSAKKSKPARSAGVKPLQSKTQWRHRFFLRVFGIGSHIVKAPGHVIFGLDYAVNFAVLNLKTAMVFCGQVMLKPAHGTKFYRWYTGLGDSPRLAIWVVFLTFVWIFSGSFSGGTVRTADNEGQGNIQSVQIKESSAELHQATINISGITKAEHKLVLRAQTSGTVARILKNKGSELKPNEPFLVLNNEIREAELKQARAAYNQKKLENQAAASLAKGGFQSRVKATEVRASFAQAEAALAQAKYNLEKSKFSVPFAGTLIASPLEVGDFVSVGTIIGTVIDLDPMKITGYISEKEVRQLSDKVAVEVVIDGEFHLGEVVFISPSADERTRSFEVEILVHNEEGAIRDGVPVTIRLPESKRLAHFISAGWLTLDSLGAVGVRVVDENNIVRFITIDIIEDIGSGIWVTGLPEDVRVITVGQESVAEGEMVVAVPNET